MAKKKKVRRNKIKKPDKEDLKKLYELKMEYNLKIAEITVTLFLTGGLLIFSAFSLGVNLPNLIVGFSACGMVYFLVAFFVSSSFIKRAKKTGEDFEKLLGIETKE